MFESNDTRHIDLHLPTGWNRCTTEELEAIAAAIIQEQQRVDRYHPFDWQRVKLNTVLSINEISVFRNNEMSSGGGRNVEMPKFRNVEAVAAADDEWLVQRPQDKDPWPISVGQLVALTDMLAWIDDEKSDKTVFMFPYPEIDVRCKKEEGRWKREEGRWKREGGRAISHLQGPPPLLDGYTWKEYRWLTDWMQEYMRCANAMADGRGKREDVRGKTQAALDSARNEFLAVLFKAGDGCGTAVNSTLFAEFSPVQWQVILFWWSSLMALLAKKFPKVFKSQPVGKGKRKQQKQDTPWDFYNRVTATIQKYVGGLSSQDVDNQPYGVTLQQLEMMADEAAEMEKLKNKK